eukprot:483485-Pelagomonas_calceolata.AAC.1
MHAGWRRLLAFSGRPAGAWLCERPGHCQVREVPGGCCGAGAAHGQGHVGRLEACCLSGRCGAGAAQGQVCFRFRALDLSWKVKSLLPWGQPRGRSRTWRGVGSVKDTGTKDGCSCVTRSCAWAGCAMWGSKLAAPLCRGAGAALGHVCASLLLLPCGAVKERCVLPCHCCLVVR